MQPSQCALNRGGLYLRRLVAPCGTRLAKVGRLFPGKDYPIPATWFSGKLRLQVGDLIHWRYTGWVRVHEAERILRVRKGAVVREHRVDTRQLWVKLAQQQDWEMDEWAKSEVSSGKATLAFWHTARGAARPFLLYADDAGDA